ncbi:putative phosphoribosyltransferase [Kibdelosporangium banguiense]|uniref:Phosphoribosyltransferase n=1 Tax=Kibdelosporangium banguiense TaxID=1365924 RepID=A0ABS4T5Y7_9PSEU|nr:putative phosphoribosyltransferase [Kibdelosporangium banguiense]
MIVLALPRGGVPVGYEVAQALSVPMDVLLVRKLGMPGQEELAMGAIAGGDVVLNEDVVRHIPQDDVAAVIRRESSELRRRDAAYRSGRPVAEIEGRIVIVVDDGLATGASMRAAVQALRPRNPKKIVVAVPIAPRSTRREFAMIVDEIACLVTPEPFSAVGRAYKDFTQVSDDQVRSLLR